MEGVGQGPPSLPQARGAIAGNNKGNK